MLITGLWPLFVLAVAYWLVAHAAHWFVAHVVDWLVALDTDLFVPRVAHCLAVHAAD